MTTAVPVRSPGALSALLGLALLALLPAAGSPPLFAPTGPAVREFRLRLSPAAVAALRTAPRTYVPAELRLDERPPLTIGVHLKGATGSFRPVDDRPGLTLDLDRLAPGQGLDGHSKLHLNNSVEDPSRLSEWLGHELFGRAGLPTPRVGHARVWLNDRNLGLYVLRAGFTADFLRQAFPETPGTLWEPAPGADVGDSFRPDAQTGAGPEARFPALLAACRETNLVRREEQLGQQLDSDRFASLLAAEVLLGHRDGYALARNNYRIFVAAGTGRVTFLPHGFDQLFATPAGSWRPQFAGTVAQAWGTTAAGRRLYEARGRELQPRLLDGAELTRRLHAQAERLRPHLSRTEWTEIRTGVADLARRLREQAEQISRQWDSPAALPLAPAESSLLTGWRAEPAAPGGPAPDWNPDLHLASGPDAVAGWRRTVQLPPGRYRFVARVRTRGVQPLPFGQHHGVAVRRTGEATRAGGLQGDQPWQMLALDFTVTAADPAADLRLELRAQAGEAWFAADSLRLHRLP